MVPHFPVVWYVGDGGGAVFSKKAEPSQNILQGKATIRFADRDGSAHGS
jgi:hypothetical protein